MKKIKVVIKNVGEQPKAVEIQNKLEAYQQIVGGHIETFPLFKNDLCIVCNEEGRLEGLLFNFRLLGRDSVDYQFENVFVGNCFITKSSDGAEDFESLTDSDIEIVFKMFSKSGQIMFPDITGAEQ